jgi:hypothetical protein
VTQGRYLLSLAVAAVTSLAALWALALAAPLAFLDPEYPFWRAKLELLRRCDLGSVLIVGDSRAAADVIPARLGVKASNLAVGGGESIEAYVAVRRAFACPRPPRRVIVSIDAGHFVRPDLFWDRTVRFGFLRPDDLAELRRTSEALEDPSIIDQKRGDGLDRDLRALLYGARYPGLYLGSMLHGGLFARWWENRAALAAGRASRGQYFFGTANGSDVVAVEGHMRAFAPLPVLDAYFNRMLALLADRGVSVDFVAMPMNRATADSVAPAVRQGFQAYLQGYAARYRNFHIVGPVWPAWNNGWFGDEFSHLNPAGAARFSAAFAACLRARVAGASDCALDQPRLQAAPPSTQNEAQWGWFNATARDASASVAPSSKRGS